MSRRRKKRQTRNLGRITVVAALALVVVAGLILVGRTGFSGDGNEPISNSVGKSKGAEDAPITITEYSDFQCSHCANFALTTARELEKAYINAGKVRLIFRQFAFLGPDSQWAAEASECANEQGAFWPYHDKLFSSLSGSAFTKARLKSFARDLGLDGKAFSACLDSGKYADVVTKETADGRESGVRATPTFFIDGEKIEGALPFEAFQQVIERQLEELGR